MAHKIEGYTYDNQWSRTLLEQQWPHTVRATLVIGEKAYTESEVRAMLKEMEEDYHTECSRQQFANIAERHGIVLDPA